MGYFEAMTPGSMAIVLVGVAMLGGAIGSFLNVVIYRLPAGLSLVHPPSRCPRCEHPIRAHDNMPVFGWILLRGKCRDCGEPISGRYPTIEAIVMMMFLAVAWIEWFGPRFGLGLPAQVVALDELAMKVAVARVGLHLMLLTTLLGVGMIEWDGARVPRLIWLPVVLMSVFLWIFFPSLAIWPAWGYQATAVSGLIDGMVGAAAGLVVGGILFCVDRLGAKKREPSSKRQTLLLGSLCVGLVLGWQAMAVVGVVYLPILVVGGLLQRAGVVKRGLPYGLGWFVLVLAGIVVACFVDF